MPLNVWSGSAWQQASAIKVWNGSAWTSASSGKVWNGSAWVEFHGAIGATLPDQNPSTYAINIVAVDGPQAGASYARSFLVLDIDGTGRYYTDTTGAGIVDKSSSPFTWKTGGGTVSDYYAYLDTPVGSPLNVLSAATATSLQLSTQRVWYLNSFKGGAVGGTNSDSCSSTIRIKNAAGTDLVAKTIFFSTSAESDGGCPTCCFTPETLITMADMSFKRIDEVVVGDIILSYSEKLGQSVPSTVTGIITRVERPMFQYTFSNGKILNASEDHPLYVVGKGYASINPTVEYKDLGVPEVISIGDYVLDESRNKMQIANIEPIHYPETVYTFENSVFYANGVLVY